MALARPQSTTIVRSRPQAAFRTRVRRAIPAYLFILPGTAIFLTWTLYPLLYAFVMSFAEWNLIKPSRFVGLDNYRRALDDPIFWMALRTTVLYTLITVPGQMILGL